MTFLPHRGTRRTAARSCWIGQIKILDAKNSLAGFDTRTSVIDAVGATVRQVPEYVTRKTFVNA